MKRKILGLFLIMASAGILAVGVFGIQNKKTASLPSLLAQVGVTLGVEPNPYNTLNDQLNARQVQIDEEQADINAQKEAIASSAAAMPGASSPVVWYLMIAVGALALLVGLNFYFDWRRFREEQSIFPPRPQA